MDNESKREQVTERVATLRPGARVRETELNRCGHPTRRRYGLVAQVCEQMVGVIFDHFDGIGFVFPDELEPAERKPRGKGRKKLEREVARLRAVIDAVIEMKRASIAAASGRCVEAWEYYDRARQAADEALAPYERETP